jgi:hypothetical protein
VQEINFSLSLLTQFILHPYEKIKNSIERRCYICSLFELCGLNAYATDETKFIAHANSFSLTIVYSDLVEQNTIETYDFKMT